MNERIKEVRKKLGLNQTAFGERIGVTAAAISKLEIGERNVTEQMVLAICREFNVSENWLRTGNGGGEAMFELHDDKELDALFHKYKMDNDSVDIITSYVKLRSDKRTALGGLIKEFAQSILDGDIQDVRESLLYAATVHHTSTVGLERDINEAFDAKFKPITKYDAPAPAVDDGKPDELDKLLTEFADDTPPAYKMDFTSTEYVQSVIDRQKTEDDKNGKGGNSAKSG